MLRKFVALTCPIERAVKILINQSDDAGPHRYRRLQSEAERDSWPSLFVSFERRHSSPLYLGHK